MIPEDAVPIRLGIQAVLPAIKEIKHNLDGTTEQFDCHLLHRDTAYVVLCYVSERAYEVAGAKLPAGSLTIGHYWRARAYIVWEMYNPQAELQGYYIHLCSDVKLDEGLVEWHDMSVDVWVGADGRSEILDEHELRRLVNTDRIGSAEAAEICDLARQLRNDLSAIAQELRRFSAVELLATLSPRTCR